MKAHKHQWFINVVTFTDRKFVYSMLLASLFYIGKICGDIFIFVSDIYKLFSLSLLFINSANLFKETSFVFNTFFCMTTSFSLAKNNV